MPTLPKSKRPYWLPKQEVMPYSTETFYHTQAWRNLRKMFITKHPLCVECQRQGIVKVGHVVDHITPISKGGAALDESNLQTLCKRHHAIKTGKERHG